MQSKNLNLKSYFDMAQLLKIYRGTHEENRSFALKEKRLQKAPIKLLIKWLNSNLYKVTTKLNSIEYLEYISSLNSILGLVSFISGFLVGMGLLSYSGQAPVNILYYLLISIVIPIFSISITIISLFAKGKLANFLTLLFPLHWVEKIINYIAFRRRVKRFKVPFSTEFSKIFFIERVQLFSLIFSIGLLISLLLMVIATDIAFGWSTTLQISPEAFHEFIRGVGIWWRDIFPSAIPSLELVEMSHYFRLGEKLDSSMIHNADKLGAWWKFLAMSTLFYAIGLRFLFWSFTKYLLDRELEKEFLALGGVSKILNEFNRPFISTKAPKPERHLEIKESTKERITTKESDKYSVVLGWNYSLDEINLANDTTKIEAKEIIPVGGSNTFTQDVDITKKLKGKVVLYVKSWEPPTMDFIDFLEMVIENKKVEKIEIYPLGTAGKYYKSNEKDIAVWERKIETLQSNKVWIVNNE